MDQPTKAYTIGDKILIDFDGSSYPEGYDKGARFEIVGIVFFHGFRPNPQGHLMRELLTLIEYDVWMSSTHHSYCAMLNNILPNMIQGLRNE